MRDGESTEADALVVKLKEQLTAVAALTTAMDGASSAKDTATGLAALEAAMATNTFGGLPEAKNGSCCNVLHFNTQSSLEAI